MKFLLDTMVGAHSFIVRVRRSADVLRGYRILGSILDTFGPGRVLAFDDATQAVFEQLKRRRVRVGTMN